MRIERDFLQPDHLCPNQIEIGFGDPDGFVWI
jgi:hypothetical protein